MEEKVTRKEFEELKKRVADLEKELQSRSEEKADVNLKAQVAQQAFSAALKQIL